MITENDVVCFLGDSITDTALWIRRVYYYYRNTLRIPCEMYNCGVSGDTAGRAYYRLEETVFPYQPTVVVIEFGINDIKGELYVDKKVLDAECVRQRRLAMDECIFNLRRLADVFAERGVQIIFCTPTRYNDLLECEIPVRYGMSGALAELSGRIRKLAEKYQAELVDFNDALAEPMKQMYRDGASMTVEDRVHPNEQGAELLAQIFLKEMGFDIVMSWDQERLKALANTPYDDWENRRYELELKARAGHYVRWCHFYGEDEARILRSIEETIDKQENPWVVDQFRHYLEYYKEIPQYQKELLEHTRTVS